MSKAPARLGALMMAGLFLAAIALDQAIKHWVETRLDMHVQVDVLPFLALYRTYNTGVAFSMFASFGDKGLIALSRTAPSQWLARAGFALILGGAVGNLIDRAVYGHVIDYVLFHTPVWSFAIFNLADAFISVGAALVVLEEFLAWRRARPQTSND